MIDTEILNQKGKTSPMFDERTMGLLDMFAPVAGKNQQVDSLIMNILGQAVQPQEDKIDPIQQLATERLFANPNIDMGSVAQIASGNAGLDILGQSNTSGLVGQSIQKQKEAEVNALIEKGDLERAQQVEALDANGFLEYSRATKPQAGSFFNDIARGNEIAKGEGGLASLLSMIPILGQGYSYKRGETERTAETSNLIDSLLRR